MNLLAQSGAIYCRNVCRHQSYRISPRPQHRPLSSTQLKKYTDLLEVNRDSTPKEIKESFLKLSKVYHPDNKVTGSHAKFVDLKEAFDAMKDGAPTTTSGSGSQSHRSRHYYDDIDLTHAKWRERYQDRYQNYYERSSSGFGGPFSESRTPWEDMMREKRRRKEQSYRESFGSRASRPLIHATVFLGAIAWIFIYSGAILVWDYNAQIKRGVGRHNSRNYEDYVAYEKLLRKKESRKLLNLDRQTNSDETHRRTTPTSTSTGATAVSMSQQGIHVQPEIVIDVVNHDNLSDNEVESSPLISQSN